METVRTSGIDIREHLRFNFEHGDGKYNILQKIAYAGVILVLIPLMIFTGMVMSPGMEAAWPWMTEIFGGRQSARSIHFIAAWGAVRIFRRPRRCWCLPLGRSGRFAT